MCRTAKADGRLQPTMCAAEAVANDRLPRDSIPRTAPAARPTIDAPEGPGAGSSVARNKLFRSLSKIWGRGAKIGLLALADQAMVSAVRFLTTVILGRLGGASELGTYTLAFSLMITALATQESLILGPYIVSRGRLRGARQASYAGSVLIEAAILAALAAAALLGAALGLAVYSGNSALCNTVGVLAAVIPFVLLHELGRRFACAELNMNGLLRLDAATAGIQLGGLGILVAGGALSAPAVYGVLGLASALPGIAWLAKKRKATLFRWGRILGDMRRNWGVGRWMFASQLTSVLSGSATGWILAGMLGLTATGVYAACASIVHVTNPILLGLGNILLPRTAIAFAEGGHAEVRRVSRKAALVLVGLTAVAAVALVVFGQPILATVYGPSFAAYHHVVGILAVAILVNTAGMAAGKGLLALDRSGVKFVSDIAGACVTCIVTIALIPHLGIVGAALGPLTGHAVTTALRLGSYEWLTHPVRRRAPR